jgi:hypothetical protein
MLFENTVLTSSQLGSARSVRMASRRVTESETALYTPDKLALKT